MLKDLMLLRKKGLCVWDLKKDTYLDGKLIDFSASRGIPHIMLSLVLRNEQDIETGLQWELEHLDWVIGNSKISTWVRAAPNKEYLDILIRDVLKGRAEKIQQPLRNRAWSIGGV